MFVQNSTHGSCSYKIVINTLKLSNEQSHKDKLVKLAALEHLILCVT